MDNLLASNFFWDSFGYHLVREGLVEAKTNPARYATAMMTVGYAFLNGAGSMLAGPLGFGKYVRILGKPRRGNWQDMMVAACCARCDLLLTCDEEQEVRVNYLAEQFRLKVRAVQLREWLEQPT